MAVAAVKARGKREEGVEKMHRSTSVRYAEYLDLLPVREARRIRHPFRVRARSKSGRGRTRTGRIARPVEAGAGIWIGDGGRRVDGWAGNALVGRPDVPDIPP